MAYPLLAREVEEAWAGEKGLTAPRWSAGIGVKGTDIYDAQARKELAAGNITPGLGISEGRAYTASQYYAVLNRMKELNPELAAYHEAMVAEGKTVKPSGDRIARLKARVGELRELKSSYFYRDIDWVTKWLIDEEIKRLQIQARPVETGEEKPLERPTVGAVPETTAMGEYMGEIYEPAAVTPPTVSDLLAPYAEEIRAMGERAVEERGAERWWPETAPSREIPWEAGGYTGELYGVGQGPRGAISPIEGVAYPREGVTYGAPTRLPIPSWLGEFLETSMGPAGEAGMARGAYALRPMGAQAELGTEKLGKMAGYLGWGKAGAPLKFGEEYVRALEQIPGWWEEYTALSEKLFPKAVQMPKPSWRATYQR